MEFLPYPHLIATLFNGCACGPPVPFTAPSSWTWVDHPVSGLRPPTTRPVKTRFPCGYGAHAPFPRRRTQLAGPFYKKYAVELIALPLFVNTRFQVLFHSPPGVLFTFPSQYSPLSVTESYLALGGGPPVFPQGSTCLAVLWILPIGSCFHIHGFHVLWPVFPGPFC